MAHLYNKLFFALFDRFFKQNVLSTREILTVKTEYQNTIYFQNIFLYEFYFISTIFNIDSGTPCTFCCSCPELMKKILNNNDLEKIDGIVWINRSILYK